MNDRASAGHRRGVPEASRHIGAVLRYTRLGMLLIGLLPGATALGQEANEAAKSAAQAVGAAGQAAARALATDTSQASNVPGYVGTDLPQTEHTADGMNDAARRTLADANDPGGAVGTFVAEAVVSRPDVTVTAAEPGVQRAEAVQDRPNAPGWQADGLASGAVRECGMDLDDAGDGRQCGGVTYCVGAGCERVDTAANTGFVDAATQLNLVMEMGGAEFDRANMRIFSGEHRACPIRFLGGQNCCTDSGVLIEIGLAGCTAGEIELAEARSQGLTHYWGEYCAKRILGICRRRDRAWCVFTSQLGRILHEQARPQLGIGWDDCDGFTVSQIQRIDFDRVDLSEYTDTLLDPSRPPGIVLPDGQDTATSMRERIGELYERNE